ncbi:MAG: glycine cleavage system protein H [Bdellovibrionaceae bacterium]|nr:glycine cleavage system protein H [Pseudobdellovibrionaceae bacterium]
MSAEHRNFMGYIWYRIEDGVLTLGINEEAMKDFSEILSIDLPPEGEPVEEDVVIGTIETDDGPLDLYTPRAGTVVEINSQAVSDPSLVMDDPFEEGWLLRIELDQEDSDEDDNEDEDDSEEEDYFDEEEEE